MWNRDIHRWYLPILIFTSKHHYFNIFYNLSIVLLAFHLNSLRTDYLSFDLLLSFWKWKYYFASIIRSILSCSFFTNSYNSDSRASLWAWIRLDILELKMFTRVVPLYSNIIFLCFQLKNVDTWNSYHQLFYWLGDLLYKKLCQQNFRYFLLTQPSLQPHIFNILHFVLLTKDIYQVLL